MGLSFVSDVPDAMRTSFIQLWGDKRVSEGFVAKEFGTTHRVIQRWANELGLGPKA